jgi:predicted nucleic acid-binding Zn ribbon protein
MHLEKPYLTTSRYNHKKKPNVKQANAAQKHAAWLKERGLDVPTLSAKLSTRKPVVALPEYEYTKNQCSNNIAVAGGYKTGIMTKLHQESPEVQKEILAKAASHAPAFNKGPYQYIIPGTDLRDLGNKTRRDLEP